VWVRRNVGAMLASLTCLQADTTAVVGCALSGTMIGLADRLIRGAYCADMPREPLWDILLENDNRENQRVREISNRYQLEVIAENTEQMMDFKRAELRAQAAHAAVSMRGFSQVAEVQAETNARLEGIRGGLGDLLGAAHRLTDRLDDLNVTASQTLEAVDHLGELLTAGLRDVAEQLVRQQTTLESIAEALRRPYESKARELREEANNWLTAGMKRTGRDQDEDFQDAMRLLRVCVDNPIGMQDYVAWFQIGWLLWKHQQDPSAAEEAFYRASRLASVKGDQYYIESLRHLAHMRYLQSKYEDAYETEKRAASVSADHDTLFDLARYAAKTGRENEALDLLERCIRLRPTTIVTMMGESDFQG
jgi:tetratricopeptide (TPR) repeat protein